MKEQRVYFISNVQQVRKIHYFIDVLGQLNCAGAHYRGQ